MPRYWFLTSFCNEKNHRSLEKWLIQEAGVVNIQAEPRASLCQKVRKSSKQISKQMKAMMEVCDKDTGANGHNWSNFSNRISNTGLQPKL